MDVCLDPTKSHIQIIRTFEVCFLALYVITLINFLLILNIPLYYNLILPIQSTLLTASWISSFDRKDA